MRLPGLLARAAGASSALNVSADIPITVPSTQPPFAAPVSSQFLGMSLEFQYWPTYSGNATGQPNVYFNQLMQNLGDRTGHAPPVRIGGTSENTAFIDNRFQLWNETQRQEVFGPFTARSNTSIGKDWYVVAGNLLPGTEITFGLNLYDQDQVSQQAERLAEAFQGARTDLTKDVDLKYVQIGNEPNFYFPTALAYVKHWVPLAKTVLSKISMGGDGQPTFQAGSEVVAFGQWALTGSLEAGLLDDSAVANATGVLEGHQYSGAASVGNQTYPGQPPVGTLMAKGSIRSNLTNMYDGQSSARGYGIPYFTGETNTYAAEAIFGLSNTGESAIWAVDSLLRSAAMGIERVYLHSTPNRLFAVLQPGWGYTNGTGIDRPHIMPMYNGLLVVDEMIGTSGNAQIAEITVENAEVAAYGSWENGRLARMAIINSGVYEDGTRQALNVTLGNGFQPGYATVKRLGIPHTTATQGLTWAGQSYETDDGVPSGDVDEVQLQGSSVAVAASEVVLLCFK